MKKTISLVAFISCTILLNAQDFRPGYIITLAGDSIHGEINRTINARYTSCEFRSNGQVKTYTSEDIVEYGFDDSSHFIKNVEPGEFVEVIILGKLSLYKFSNGFYIRKNDKLHKLESEFIGKSATDAPKKSKKWRGIVAYLISDCESTKNSATTVKFNETSLTKTVLKYNDCSGSDVSFTKVNEKQQKVSIGVQSGFVQSSLKIEETTGFFPWIQDDNYTSLSIMFGVFFEFSAPAISDRASFLVEANYFSSTYSSDLEIVSGSLIDFHDVNIEMSSINIPIAFKYALPNKIARPYLQAGIESNYNFEYTATRESTRIENSIATTTNENAYNPKNFQIGVHGQIGVEKTVGPVNIRLGARYSLMDGIEDEPSVDSSGLRRFTVLLAISK